MTTDEFDLIAGAIKASYPASKILADATAMRFWYAMLKDVDYHIAENAVMEFASTSTFPPTIADIRKLCMERTKGPLPSFDEAWGSVQKAMRMYGQNNPEQAYCIMDEVTVSIVKNLGWTNICTDENPSASRANFRIAYEDQINERIKQRQLPEIVQKTKQMQIEQNTKQALGTKETKLIENAEPVNERVEAPADLMEELRRKLNGGETK
ncbi:MAG: hypothetical protein J6D08_12480 [Lachnospiraceae bacterium]|nr:hypothetical protein [Lachnospiraceae bacterium]